MNVRHMEIFLTVAEENSLTRAAEKLYITQPAVTQVIRKLEKEFGGELFVYRGKSKELSPLGKFCVESFQNILNQYKRLQNEAREISKGDFGSLTIYIPLRRAMKLLPFVLPVFSQKYPHVDIRTIDGKIRIDYMFNQMLDGKVDLSISLHRIVDPRVESIPFCVETMAFVASLDNPLAKKLVREGRNCVKLEELLDQKYILTSGVYKNRQLVNKMFALYNCKPTCILEVQTVELCTSLAVSNMAATIVPELMFCHQPLVSEQSHSVVFPIDHPLAKRKISVSYVKERGVTRYQKDFIDILMNMDLVRE